MDGCFSQSKNPTFHFKSSRSKKMLHKVFGVELPLHSFKYFHEIIALMVT